MSITLGFLQESGNTVSPHLISSLILFSVYFLSAFTIRNCVTDVFVEEPLTIAQEIERTGIIHNFLSLLTPTSIRSLYSHNLQNTASQGS